MLTALFLAATVFAPPPVPDPELSQMRGGFSLPGGIDVALAVQTDTSVNGNLLLRSVYRLDQGPASLQVYAPAAGQSIRGTSAAPASSNASGQGAIDVNFDRQNGVTIDRFAATPSVTVQVAGARPTAGTGNDGLQPLDVSQGPVDTPGGRVSVGALPIGFRSRIEGDGIDASHVFGAAFGSVVANTASERAIENATTVTLDLRGATPMNLGSSMLRASDLGAEAVRALVAR